MVVMVVVVATTMVVVVAMVKGVVVNDHEIKSDGDQVEQD